MWGGKCVHFCNVSWHVCSEMAKMSNFRLRDQNVSDMSDMSTFFGFDNPRSKRRRHNPQQYWSIRKNWRILRSAVVCEEEEEEAEEEEGIHQSISSRCANLSLSYLIINFLSVIIFPQFFFHRDVTFWTEEVAFRIILNDGRQTEDGRRTDRRQLATASSTTTEEKEF
jgi:hypothetical protein